MTPVYNDAGDEVIIPDDKVERFVELGWRLRPPGIDPVLVDEEDITTTVEEEE